MAIYKPSKTVIKSSAQQLLNEGLVAFPTETVYGLGCDASSENAISKIYEVKKRPTFNPLIIHIANLTQATQIGCFDKISLKLGKNFWPGPLTIIVPIKKTAKLSRLATAGLDTVALRVPDNPIAKQLIEISNKPLAAPSANPSGRLSPTTAEHVKKNLGHLVDTILDGGQTKLGIESTIVTCIENKCYLVRAGALTNDRIEKVIGLKIFSLNNNKPIGPGNLKHHYSPSLPIRINAKEVFPHEALLAFGNNFPLGASITLNLSKNSNLREAASNFFSMLHKLDSSSADSIAVSPIPNVGLGIAINDRLDRASADIVE